jgi:hypothetical protein
VAGLGILRAIFGPSKDEIWQNFCQQVGADFIAGGFWKGSKVEASHRNWTVIFDTYSQDSGNNTSTTYTRIRAPYVNPNKFKFCIYRAGFFTPLASMIGLQDITIGDQAFDDAFVIKSNNEEQVKWLFSDPTLRSLLQQLPKVYFEVRDDEGWFGTKFPNGVDELYFRTIGVIKDVEQLKILYALFAETLNRLCHIGEAYENDPNLKL